MTPKSRRVLVIGRRLMVCTAIGFACGAIPGVLYVLVGWFPSAMTTYAENPQFSDPRQSVLEWTGVWAVSLGVVGALIGFGVGAIPDLRESLVDASGAVPEDTPREAA